MASSCRKSSTIQIALSNLEYQEPYLTPNVICAAWDPVVIAEETGENDDRRNPTNLKLVQGSST
ncbi:hypothetical protein PILCRDRAFT_818671 [Piloderma croceum F 1598]|uniref:Uncharacterized protein n=1 Tax=Piloderma croceum (strain F 1598) TaxID=765440 RepID=A0A0C3G0V5_PILCF|nr:hypothetical protein PILCRDRAFT_818671 [Piloderma croceum F 1598]